MPIKKILNILDTIELQGITLEEAPMLVLQALQKEQYELQLFEIEEFIHYLHRKGLLHVSINGIDVYPAPTIYAKSAQQSGLEALAIMESYLHDLDVLHVCVNQYKSNTFIIKQIFFQNIDDNTRDTLLQTVLFEAKQDQIRFNPKLIKGIADIVEEYLTHTPLISTALTALYTAVIVHHNDSKIAYKNVQAPMITYPRADIITGIIARRGVPQDRDETKLLQMFYKDTLFHEFDHACPICNITIPHMLIASHIKPFRDCAHIYEAIDHNNGLLLCRNHDYLFDQGYFTFQDDGKIILSHSLLKKGHLENAYTLSSDFHLPKRFLTNERKLFLHYHRVNIYMDHNKNINTK